MGHSMGWSMETGRNGSLSPCLETNWNAPTGTFRTQEVYRKKHESKHRIWLSSMRAVCFHIGLESHLVRNLELSECHLVLRKWQVLEPCWNSDLGMREIELSMGMSPMQWHGAVLVQALWWGTFILYWRQKQPYTHGDGGNHTVRQPTRKMNPVGVHWRKQSRVPCKARVHPWAWRCPEETQPT